MEQAVKTSNGGGAVTSCCVDTDNTTHYNNYTHTVPTHTSESNGVTLIFKDVCVTFGDKQILNNVTGMATVGQMLAVMGPSGAGKSTLLNTLTGRVVTSGGHVTLNGEPVTRRLRRKLSYVLQDDVFYPNITLRETLTYMTLLRLPGSMPHALKMARMQEIVDALELNKCLNTRMGGTFVTGLSGGEKKRASIACELLTNPRLIILDEPTSGLDAAIAYSLMATLDNYAKLSRKTVVTTIHQPSSAIFHMFTNILLLADGQVAYFGPGRKIVSFFERQGMICEQHYNPADFILEQLKSSPDNAVKLISAAHQLRYTDDWPAQLREDGIASGNEVSWSIDCNTDQRNVISPDEVRVIDDVTVHRPRKITDRPESIQEVDVESYYNPDVKFQTGFLTQYWTLTKRNFQRQRPRYFSKLNLSQVLFMAVFAGLVWFRTERSEQSARDRLGILFFVAVQFGFLPAMDAVTALTDDNGVFMRERSAGLYRLSAYFLAVMTTEIPVTVVMPTVYTLINYFIVNLMPAARNFIGHWLLLVLSTLAAQSVGMLISVVITSTVFTVSICNTFMIASLLAGGYYNTHVQAWFRWIRFISFLFYTLGGMACVEFSYGDPFTCDPAKTEFPAICQNSNSTIPGDVLLAAWDINQVPLWLNIVALLVVVVMCRVLAYFVLRFLRRPHI